ncbi:MAG TPA: ABC transporter ATP-binding protein [Puia sp.]|nr:ABC transporter ATP-binding protein [Puia sp.]
MKWKKTKLFLSFLYPYWFKEAMLFLLMIIGTISGLASPYALKIILDESIPHKDLNGLIGILSLLALIYLLRLLTGILSDYLTTWISNKVVNDIKIRLFSNLLTFPYVYFEDNKPGDIIQKVNHEIHKVQSFLTSSLIRFSNNFFNISGLSVMLFLLDKNLFFLSMIVFPASILINRSLNKRIKRLIKQSSKQEGELYNFFIDRLKNIKVIKGFNGLQRETRGITERLSRLFDIYQKTSNYSSVSRNASTFFVVLGPLIVLGYGGHRVIASSLTVGALVAFIQYMNRFYAPSSDMVYLYVDYVRAKVSMDRIMPLLMGPPESQELQINGKRGAGYGEDRPGNAGDQYALPPEGGRWPMGTVYSLRLENIYFCFGDNKVLQGFSMEFVKGKRYALVGLSGSGKSTLIKLLCRFYVPLNGRIIVNGDLPLDQVELHEWNESISVIHQEPLLFMESLRHNLTYGNTHAPDAMLWTALDNAGCTSFVTGLPQLLDTFLGEGEGSVMLSGGQQQQVSLARAFLRNTDILVLDEATSAIDSYKEKKILRRLQECFGDKIIISVSHRLSSIKDFDEIIVLKDGRLIEKGTHDQLVRIKGIYYTQFENQLNDVASSFA